MHVQTIAGGKLLRKKTSLSSFLKKSHYLLLPEAEESGAFSAANKSVEAPLSVVNAKEGHTTIMMPKYEPKLLSTPAKMVKVGCSEIFFSTRTLPL